MIKLSWSAEQKFVRLEFNAQKRVALVWDRCRRRRLAQEVCALNWHMNPEGDRSLSPVLLKGERERCFHERPNARGKLRRSEAEGTNRQSLLASA